MNIANRYAQKYYLSHADEIAQAQEKYRLNNPEVFRANNKKYYEKNKGIKVDCCCGVSCEKLYFSVHKKSKKHLTFLANNPSAVEPSLKPPAVDYTKVLCLKCGESIIKCRKLFHAEITEDVKTI